MLWNYFTKYWDEVGIGLISYQDPREDPNYQYGHNNKGWREQGPDGGDGGGSGGGSSSVGCCGGAAAGSSGGGVSSINCNQG